MDVFGVREQLIRDYRAFTSSFVDVRDDRVREYVERLVDRGHQWPEPRLSLNPNFAPGGTVDEAAALGLITKRTAEIFRVKSAPDDTNAPPLRLHLHQRQAIEMARTGKSYVLTTGTGSGKSLAYLVPIVDRVLRAHEDGTYRPGVKAIIVYPMNALANSQLHEMEKFLGRDRDRRAVSFDRYTGQEDPERRREILQNPPDVLLTNYVMLELVLTRARERERLVKAAQGLWFLVLDELHTYRGRQGADVAFLVRRTRDACAAPDLQCVGTSATMTSQGSSAEQTAQVARVASRLFGTSIEPGQVIGETLQRAVIAKGSVTDDLTASVHRWVKQGDGMMPDYDEFVHDPLAAWVETCFGLEEADGQLVRRRQPYRVSDVAQQLSRRTGIGVEDCTEAIRSVLRAGSSIMDPATGRPVFAFRLHQFLSKGDNVYVTIESPARRYITNRYQAVSPDSSEAQRKILLPLAFCRECGQEYLSARRTAGGFEPRQDQDLASDADGYLYISDDYPWPETEELVLSDGRLPYSWTVQADDGATVIAPNKRAHLPQPVHVAVDGSETEPGKGVAAAWLESPFRFCIRCRVSYERRGGKDFAQLAKLSAEGRSSAVSVIGASVVRTLRASTELPKQAQKLLGFVDNRQDASLQAGHFNDFVQVVQLRGALYRALVAEPDGLTHERIAERVTQSLGLEMADFAKVPDARYGMREEAWRALREVVNYRLYQDLERGWRVTMPNLEQTGLLRIEYRGLSEITSDEGLWASSHPLLRDDTPQRRYEVAATLLDELRRNLAIEERSLTESGFDEIRRLSMQHLNETWGLGERERVATAQIAFPRPSGKGSPRSHLHLSGRGAFGKYLVRVYGRGCTAADAQEVIRGLLAVLSDVGLVRRVSAATGSGRSGFRRGRAPAVVDEGEFGYRLDASALLWRADTGEFGAEDRVRKTLDAGTAARVNPFFRDLYKETSDLLAGMRAREHTAQVSPADREEREKEFREADLPLLFCSSTMELGVDIAALNAVVLRNVPPTPANYAQRAGRAGRSGQPALVVTYCSTGNSHDQYYFQRQTEMVSGSVAAPRLDLANEDLIKAHVHAIWLAETGVDLPGELTKVVDASGDDPPLTLLPEIAAKLDDPQARARAVARAANVLGADLALEIQSAPWWRPTWVEEVVGRARRSFDDALIRWKELYRAARLEFETQNRRSVDTAVSAAARDEAARRARDARVQLTLLSNDGGDDAQTDFYTYRYLAAEGFLPGYSFPRLPVAAYVPGLSGRREGDYIHRPRFIGISEFGPGALIYHEGSRYMVRSVQLPASQPGQEGLITTSARRCRACGYLHEDKAGIDVCEGCGEQLDASSITNNLLRLLTVRTVRRERISSDEEERRRSGFEIETSYRFQQHHGNRPGSLRATVRGHDGTELAEMVYGDAATVRRANLGLSRRKDRKTVGYWLNTMTGEWLSETRADAMADPTDVGDDDDQGRADKTKQKQRVIPFVEDRRNILVLRLSQRVTPELTVTLMNALERAAEAVFQLEDTELTGEILPDEERHARMLLVESAEGGAGALRRLVEEPHLLADVARKALEIAHFNPDTGADEGDSLTDLADQPARCVQGCYECLLSYANQLQHRQIDRHLIVGTLLAFSKATTVAQTPPRPATAAGGIDGAPAQFLAWLSTNGYRLPDATAEPVRGTAAVADLIYRDSTTAVFVDTPGVAPPAGRDAVAEESLLDAGWNVIRVPAGEWRSTVNKYPRVFGSHQGEAP